MTVTLNLSAGVPFVEYAAVDLYARSIPFPRAEAATQLLPTDVVGSMTLTLTNVVVGSRYRIERQGDGSLATPTGNAEGVAGASTVTITLDYYAGGSANNDLRIKVRKGSSAPKYQPFETLATIAAGAQSVYVAQVADTIAA
jgi:hypothetical protein